MKVKNYEVRFGELEEHFVNKYICIKQKKFVKVFKKTQYKKALNFAKSVDSKVEVVFTI